jgi:tripeptide aminopeptidase
VEFGARRLRRGPDGRSLAGVGADERAAVATARRLIGDLDDVAGRVLEEAAAISLVPAPTSLERARAEAVREKLGPAAGVDATGNVMRRHPGRRGGHAIAVAAHLDTVFAVGMPLSVTRGPGRLTGPGIGDNAVAIAALLALDRVLSRSGPLGCDVVLCFTVGEEGRGDLRGARAAVDELRPDLFLAVEGHMLDRLSGAGLGSVRYEARFKGPGGHSWADRGAPSAVHGLLIAGARLVALSRPDQAALSVGVIEGGTSVNAIAAEARLEVDLRATDQAVLDDMAARARAAIVDAARQAGIAVGLDPIGCRPAAALPHDHPLLSRLRAVRAATALPPGDEEAVSTDANAALAAGIPAATLGITRGGGMHTPEEWIEVGPVADGVLQLVAAVLALADSPP